MAFHEMVHPVYFDDLDAYQILHNSRYLLMFERAIGSFWDRLGFGGWQQRRHDPDMHQLVRANHVEYHRAIEGTGDVRVRVWVEKLGHTSITFGVRVMPMDAETDFATGSRVIVHIDLASKRPTPWGDEFREKVRPFRHDLGDAEAGR